LIGTPEAQNDPAVRDALLRRKDNGGFEAALSDMQGAYLQNRGPREKESLDRLKSAINSMFSDMDQGFAAQDFEFQSDIAYMVRTFLIQFDAICSLNQDCLPELHYLNDDLQLGSMGRWDARIIFACGTLCHKRESAGGRKLTLVKRPCFHSC
jgi:hypothetical protein